ncbi:MAG: xanthine dehydrogenase family protein molybdopterin-binding subunit [Christensenellaceae bacterium]|jgi:CO/xanthine dehydrogenase Mo-binding subunit|nr:xanthine dehydrogenase family protein molybdopterin-binding subunit [Christensenellaceae bacterium]
MKKNLQLVGTAVPRHDAWAKAKGEQLYSDDFTMPQMLYGKVLRSKYPAAILRGIDISKAKALPGVRAVLTAADVPKNEDITKFGQMRDVGGGFEGLYKVLANGKVRSKSEAIALVAADTEELAEYACTLIEVDYEVTEGVFDPRESIKEGAYVVSSEDKDNIVMRTKVEDGDINAAWALCDVVVEGDYFTTPHEHAYIETEGGMAWIDENEVVTLRVGTQVLEHYRTMAKILGLPHTKVRNMSVPMGGGFGGKEDMTVEMYLALLTLATRRPVKMVWSREESMDTHAKRHPEYLHYKTGATKDGKIMAQEVSIVMDSGSYTYLTPWVQMYSTQAAAGPYQIPNVRVQSVSAFTNNTFSSANRGFGGTQVNFAYERQIEELAAKLNMSPLELRRRNIVHNGDPLPTGFIPQGHIALEELLAKVDKELNRTPKPERLPDGRKVGRAIAIGHMVYGRLTFLHDSSRVSLRVELDGSVTLRAGVPDLGGGQASVLCQIIAEELGLKITDVHPYIMDTHLTPLCGTTTATRQLYMSGNATYKCVSIMKERVLEKASSILGYPPDMLELANRKVYLINNPLVNIPFETVIGHISNDGGELELIAQFNAPFTEVPDLADIKSRLNPDLTYTCHGVEVAVDEETGQFEMLRLIAACDAGKMINKNSCEGQIEGGAVYDALWATHEDLQWRNGITKANNFSTYLIPTSVDVPDVETIILESGGGLGPYGAKGVGEPSDNSIAPALVNAIRDAIGTGLNLNKMPVTAEKILAAVKGIDIEK